MSWAELLVKPIRNNGHTIILDWALPSLTQTLEVEFILNGLGLILLNYVIVMPDINSIQSKV